METLTIRLGTIRRLASDDAIDILGCSVLMKSSDREEGEQVLQEDGLSVRIVKIRPREVKAYLYNRCHGQIGYIDRRSSRVVYADGRPSDRNERHRRCALFFPPAAIEAVWKAADTEGGIANRLLTLTVGPSPSRGPYYLDVVRAEFDGRAVTFNDMVDLYSEVIGRTATPDDVAKAREEHGEAIRKLTASPPSNKLVLSRSAGYFIIAIAALKIMAYAVHMLS